MLGIDYTRIINKIDKTSALAETNQDSHLKAAGKYDPSQAQFCPQGLGFRARSLWIDFLWAEHVYEGIVIILWLKRGVKIRTKLD